MRFSFGLSSYFLWTVKGATVMPLVRGSGFLIQSEGSHAFHKYHVITAGHVACPVQFPRVFGGDSPGLRAIGERHITTGALCPVSHDGRSTPRAFPMLFPQKRFLNVDVAALRLKNESSSIQELFEMGVTPLEVDTTPLERDEELEFCGVRSFESLTNSTDEELQVEHDSLCGSSHSTVISHDYGTIIVARLNDDIDSTMCGGPVIRKSNGKCVGVIVARVGALGATDPPISPDASKLVRKPCLDLSSTPGLEGDASMLRAAFVPARDFITQLRNSSL